MHRNGTVYVNGQLAGHLREVPGGYELVYDPGYIVVPHTPAISMTLPKRSEPYTSSVLFPFFYGLLAEGILKQTQCRKLKLDENDHFGRLLKTAHGDTIGAVTVLESSEA